MPTMQLNNSFRFRDRRQCITVLFIKTLSYINRTSSNWFEVFGYSQSSKSFSQGSLLVSIFRYKYKYSWDDWFMNEEGFCWSVSQGINGYYEVKGNHQWISLSASQYKEHCIISCNLLDFFHVINQRLDYKVLYALRTAGHHILSVFKHKAKSKIYNKLSMHRKSKIYNGCKRAQKIQIARNWWCSICII